MKKTTFIIVKILITIVSLAAVILAQSHIDWVNFANNYVDKELVRQIVFDLSAGVFSAMILVFFIDGISEKVQNQQSAKQEKKHIQRCDKILQCYIDEYITAFYCVTTPLLERDFKRVSMKATFNLKDMRDLHETSLMIKEKLYSGSVEKFLQVELDLRNEFLTIVKNYDFIHYPTFPEIFLEYIQTSIKFDSRPSILEVPQLTVGDISKKQFIHDLLENHADTYYKEMQSGKPFASNAVTPYFFLYILMNEERDIILRYREEINKL